MLKEFKEFISKGNVIDLAVGVIIGGAFGKIVSSLVNDIIMPLVGILLGGLDFTSLTIKIKDSTIAYGSFIQNVVDFLIISASIFLAIKVLNGFKKKGEELEEKLEEKFEGKIEGKKEEKPKPEEKKESTDDILIEIRDLLKKKK